MKEEAGWFLKCLTVDVCQCCYLLPLHPLGFSIQYVAHPDFSQQYTNHILQNKGII